MYKYRFSFLMVISFVLFVAIIIAISCKKSLDNNGSVDPTAFDELVVDENFKFENMKEISLDISVDPGYLSYQGFVIKIYSEDPALSGKLMKTGVTNDDLLFSTNLRIPTYVNKIYLRFLSTGGFDEVVSVDISDNAVTYHYDAGGKYKKGGDGLLFRGDPGCVNCTHTLSGSGTALIHPGDRFCVEVGNTWSGQVKFYDGGELVVCGEATINLNPGSDGGIIYISDGGTAQFADLYLRYFTRLENYGTVTIGNVFSIGFDGSLENHGNLSCGTLTNYLNGSGIINYGTISAQQFINNLHEITNYGLIQATTYMSNNSNAVLENNCQITTGTHFNQVGVLNNNANSLLQVGDVFDCWPGSTVNMGEKAMIYTTDFELDGTINGPVTECARLQITNETIIGSAGIVNNNMDLCDENGIEINEGTIAPSVTFCECYIPVGNCNPIGAGTPPIQDSDGDGVPDDIDEYPFDPERAFNSYYPNEENFGSLAFEDLWPSLGDYDFNDLVLDFQYQMVTNADNDYVDLLGRFLIKAVGASMDNGFGFIIPVIPGNVNSVSGSEIFGSVVSLDPAGYEAGHTQQTVVIVYDAIVTMVSWSMINTTHGGPTMEFDTTLINVYFGTPLSDIGSPPFNPFVFINQLGLI